jgi:hypothetical protein
MHGNNRVQIRNAGNAVTRPAARDLANIVSESRGVDAGLRTSRQVNWPYGVPELGAAIALTFGR